MKRSKKSATAEADRLFSLHIRKRGVCELAEWFPAITCNGNHQCCHLISRRYKAIRWDDANARCGCAAHHMYGTWHPLEWDVALEEAGVQLGELRHWALNGTPMDPYEVIERLKEVA